MSALPSNRESQNTTAQSSASSSTLSRKGSGDSPEHGARHDAVELKDINSGNGGEELLPIEEDIMQLARLGEIPAIQKLFESGKFDAKYRDAEDITPLHVCADVNAKGGESVATPAMWAAQRCHYYIVELLLQRGADPLLTDAQGYNILHLATIDGNAFLLVLLLHQEIPVDVTDSQGHTGLMWAAYKGFPACVDLFLRWGANVNAVDEAGFTPLHWALVKGSTPCIQKLLEYGADRFAKTRDGKTPATAAEEMKTTFFWHRALRECGYKPNGDVIQMPFGLATILRTRRYVSKFFFLWPFAIILGAVWILSEFSVYISVPLTLAFVFGMQWVAQWVANRSQVEFRVLQRTPFLAGVFAASLFWVGVRWLMKVLPHTYSSDPFLNFFFAVFFSLTTYFYSLSMTGDPGYVPKLSSRNQQRDVISDLFKTWQFDEDNFFIVPGLTTALGPIISGISFYLESLPSPPDSECNILSSSLCSMVKRDTFTIILTVWIAIQLVWITLLCAVQLVQISRNQTTYENMKGHSFDYADPAARAITSALTTGTTSAELGGLDSTGQGPNPSIPPSGPGRHRHAHGGCFAQWKKLLGLDTFMATAQHGLGDRRASRSRNPFSRGIVTNCRDFWCDPSPYFGRRETGMAMLDGSVINYNTMYEVPLRLRTGGSGMVYRSVATEDV
ncbi:palmitoyltransferase akr1 [Uncinocarpus reesii 1704]|uniref:protein S-acyltransferase n=1 Tax=Uncinocarpus reesii (strain UAMH 1704) TaxID=336963 RepID=C4JF13_UNCRE|nr:palmitoyltransferase akr1 [Uncinocarpus reesii 1704]EEP76066.1 palmitoyltransferase akr1 [Uncinocarpus reesii 1704]